MSRRLTAPATAPIGASTLPPPRFGHWPWILGAILLTAVCGWWVSQTFGEKEPIIVGILHALSGPTAPQERLLIDAEVLGSRRSIAPAACWDAKCAG